MVEKHSTEQLAIGGSAQAGFLQSQSVITPGAEQNQFLCASSRYYDYQYYHFDMKGNHPIGFCTSWLGAFQ
jgi:hypothetical protein